MKAHDPKPSTSSNSEPLAIIGIGCLFPQADDQHAYWSNITEGVDSITDIPATHWKTGDYYDQDQKSPDRTYGQRGGFISPVDFNPMEFNIPPNVLEAIDTSQLLGLIAAGQALKDAGYGPEREFDHRKTSVILGVTGTLELVIPLGARLGHPIWNRALKEAGVEQSVADDVVQRISDAYVPWQENSFPGLLGNVVAGRISKQFDLGGTNCVVDAACASSFGALHLAAMELATGKSDMVITGGIDTFNDIFMYMCFSKTPALSPSGNAKPFDSSADGTILGEGLGIVVLKRLADAERDNDRIYAVIRGIGSSSDGKGDAIYAPSAAGQKKALLDAYDRAGVTPETIGLVEAHGTGTKVGDVVEISALRDVYGEATNPWCSLSSVKAQIGHTKAAAGAAGMIKAALALHHKVLPPTIKVKNPLKEVTCGATPFYLATEKRPWLPRGDMPRRAGVSAFGFGGSNFHLVLEEYHSTKETVQWNGNVQLISLSGSDAAQLDQALANLPANGSWSELRQAAAASRTSFDASEPCRLALVVERNQTKLDILVANARTMLTKNPDSAWNTPDGAFFARGKTAGSLAMLFPGQGAQYTGMLRDLICHFPQGLETLAAADSGFSAAESALLSDLIYPISAFDSETKGRQEDALRQTQVAQPAIGAVSLTALKILEAFGVLPEAVAGHSYGELTALCAAGCYDETELHQLSRLRGRLMAEGSGDRGSMLAVQAPLATVEKIISEAKLDLVIANRNAPLQAVLSGSSAEIERATAVFSDNNLNAKQLPVAAAFHSSLVADAAVPFLAELEKMEFTPARIPVYANSSAAEYPADAAQAKTLLAHQLARPVEFVAEIEAMYAAGARTFVEVGPGARLIGLVSAILGKREHVAMAMDASAGMRSGIADLARTLARLAVLGHNVRLTAWDAGYQPPLANAKKPAMTIPICGANYVKPKPQRPPVARNPKPGTRDQESLLPVPGTQPPISDFRSPVPGPHSPVSDFQSPVPGHQSHAVPRDALLESLRITREGMSVLQKMQEETAQLHRRFLDGQETASRTILTLLEQQQSLMQGGGVPQPLPATRPPMMIETAPVAAVVAPITVQERPAIAAPPAPTPGKAVTETLLAVISEKTGYPVEMLELDMGMDSDLGIDSIKRVEILSALQERLPGAPTIGPEHLGTLHTLGEIATFLAAGSAPTASTPQPFTAAPSLSTTTVNETLLTVVSEKTGYPVEMLELDMGMDSDLGIDSIKRVEILSALQERLPGAPTIGPEHLGTLRTLSEIATFLSAGSPAATGASHPPASVPTLSATSVSETLLAVVSEKTGYPVEMLELDMGMDSDLGIDSIKRVEILSALQERLPGAPTIGPEHLGTLRTLGEIASYLSAGAAPVAAAMEQTPAFPAPLQSTDPTISAATVNRSTIVPVVLKSATGPITLTATGEIWVTDDGSAFSADLRQLLASSGRTVRLLTVEDAQEAAPTADMAGLVIVAPLAGTDDRFLEQAFQLLKSAAPTLRRSGATGGALFTTVSRLDGSFGCGAGTALSDPLSGGLAGLVKTAAREWSEVTCKAIDLGQFPEPGAAARAVADELLLSGPVEVGLMPEGRLALELVALPSLQAPLTPPIREGEVVVVTGGGRGVTTEAAVALARAYRPLLVLLGRSRLQTDEPAWLAQLTDESQIKRAILEHATEKLHPKAIEEQYRALMAGRELRTTLARVTAAGGTAIYCSVDIRNSQAVNDLLQQIRREHGPIRGIIHGAGVLADRLITDKTLEQFAMVYGTKVGGLRSLLDATVGDDLRFIALFASTTGRFGRSGQVDYAVANEVLNKLAQAEARRRAGCRSVSINWGPWDGGMVTPALKKVFAGEGIGLIGLAEGGELLIREIAAADAPVEVVAMAAATQEALVLPKPASSKQLTETFNLTLSVDDYPFLRSHVMDGKAVLPMAMIVEWLSHGALHDHPGFRFHGFNDLRICKGVVFEHTTPYGVRIMAGRAQKRDSLYNVTVELVGSGYEGRPVLHARGEIVLARKLPEGIRSIPDPPAAPYAPYNGRIYDPQRLFHGPDLHGIEQVESCSAKGASALVKAAPQPSSWIRNPFRSDWISDPLSMDSAFQLMILWSFDRFGAGSLPCFAGRFRQYHDRFPREGVQVVIRVTAEREHGATADMEFLDRQTGKLVARLEGYECVIDPSLAHAFQRNKLSQANRSALRAA
ncbi:MAG: KR domain-containing protein [Desulfuromonadales bacterium]|nr:KR domain-containing protein [Desulfuromonadales bacterium]